MEDLTDTRYRRDLYSKSFVAHSPKGSGEISGEISNPSIQRKNRHISFNTPVSKEESKSTTITHSRNLSDTYTPQSRLSVLTPQDAKSREYSL